MEKENLNEILANHRRWLAKMGGARADLHRADLIEADLSRADFRHADLSEADLSRADFRHTDLSNADLSEANLYGADLRKADLSEANLCRACLGEACLSGADLRGANLCDADLSNANLSEARLSPFQICPEEGNFIGWKKLSQGVIAKLEIPADAKRTSSLVSRKCRASKALVLEGEGDSPIAHLSPISSSTKLHYAPGMMIEADSFNDDIRLDCSHGLHFFITRKEAEDF